MRGVGRRRVQGGERTAGQGEPDTEDDQALRLVADGAAPAAHAEGQAPVGGRVGDGRDEQGERVGDLRPRERTEAAVEQQIEERGQGADHTEADELAGQALGYAGELAVARVVAEGAGEPVERQRTGGEGAAHAPHALEVVGRGLHDVHRRVRVVDPVDRHLVDPQPGPLGEDQHLGVEEPAGVLDQRQQHLRDIAPDRLEAALGVGEAGLQRAAQDQVVRAAR